MPKNVVLCCDGTANEFAQNNTNVVKLYFTVVQDPAMQVAFYHPGIGTMEAVGALTTLSRKVTKVAGLAFGYGLESDIRDAYVFLMNHFEAGDQIFLFGFSRGAYTVRVVASLLHMYGLLEKGNEPLVPYAIRLMTAIDRHKNPPGQTDGSKEAEEVHKYFKLAAEFKATFSRRPVNLHFVGVWDTVSSVGWIENPLRVPYSADNPEIAIGRHAISIDERRAFFRTNLWRPHPAPQSGQRDLKQVWFPGVHSDVGGGYPEAESGLAKCALDWMLSEAAQAGLLTESAKVDLVLGKSSGGYVPPDPTAKMHESLTWKWWPAELLFKRHYDYDRKMDTRRMNLGRPRTIPSGALIHRSAYQRGDDYKKKLPPDGIQVD